EQVVPDEVIAACGVAPGALRRKRRKEDHHAPPPTHTPPRRRRVAGLALFRRVRPGPRRRRTAATAHGLPLRAAGPAPGLLLPREGREGLRTHAVPRSPQGLPRPIHGRVRPFARGAEPGVRAPGFGQLPDRRTERRPPRVQELDL